MINPFAIKKWISLLIGPLLTVVLFFIALTFYGLLIGLAFMGVGLLLGAILGNLMLKNPFTMMLEGKGLLCINMDSTGILRPFIVGLDNPYMHGKIGKSHVRDIFDRATVLQLARPQKNTTSLKQTKEGGIEIKLDEQKYNEGRFALFHYPVLIWNDQLKQILTKDFFSEGEKNAFAEHGVLYLNKQLEDLNRYLLNFGRYIVENLKPKSDIWQNKWVIIVIIVAGIALMALFVPAIIKAMSGVSGPVSEAIKSAGTSGALTPLK